MDLLFGLSKMVIYFLLFISSIPNINGILILCAFPNWAVYRTRIAGLGQYTVDNIDPQLCTHVLYQFTILDNKTLEISIKDHTVDIDKGGYEKLAALKSKNNQLKTMITLGSWEDANDGTDKYSRLITNGSTIDTFVNSVMAFLHLYKFDGLNLDYDYTSKAVIKDDFSNLLIALKNAFKPKGYLLSAVVPAAASTYSSSLDGDYDISSLNENLDFISLRTFYFHGHWEPTEADHHSPLYKRAWEINNQNSDYAVTYWIGKGLLANKIALGIPLFGLSWVLSTHSIVPPAAANGAIPAAGIIGEAGKMAYYEICDAIRTKQWKMVRDPSQAIGPYAVSPDHPRTWVGYDDPEMAAVKSRYILSKGLAGAFLWDISYDDFRNTCGGGFNPITTAIYNTLNGYSHTPNDFGDTNSSEPVDFSSILASSEMGQWPTLLVVAVSWILCNVGLGSANPRLVCYFNSGAILRKGNGHFTVDNIDPFLCTHLIYVSATFEGVINGATDKQEGPGRSRNLDPSVTKFVQLKTKNPKLKTMVSIGSWIEYQSTQYVEKVTNSGNSMAAFGDAAVQFLARYGFDGLDFSWPWIGVTSAANDPRKFIRLLEVLKKAFQSGGYLLSIAVIPNDSYSSYDIPKIERLVDFVNLKSYNMTGSWKSMADHHAPLYPRKWEGPGNENNNVDSMVSYWVNQGFPESKINMGIPFFGNSWTLSSGAYNPPAAASGPGAAGPFTATQGELAFYEICQHVRVDKDFKAVRTSSRVNGPFAYSLHTSGRIWVGYDDTDMVVYKGKYIISRQLGGAVVWDISMDDFQDSCGTGRNPLLVSLARTLNVMDRHAQPFVSGSCRPSSFHLASFSSMMLLTLMITSYLLASPT
ncbi:probable chitinase 10 [Daphnia carinata]|uniref:probable chitinase 10 n=1 Tax=Daphnia carinata TaxID=120202 RepID=UPI0028689018|nr:probable chitinase 10 [Daphnia carinata]